MCWCSCAGIVAFSAWTESSFPVLDSLLVSNWFSTHLIMHPKMIDDWKLLHPAQPLSHSTLVQIL